MRKGSFLSLLLAIIPALFLWISSVAAGNIDPDSNGSRYTYGENIGWLNFDAPLSPGVTVTDSLVTGFVWSENTGWISLSCLDTGSCGTLSYGIINNGAGNLSGNAWGENIGWVNFEPTGGGVQIDECGDFSGQAWGENIGWINFGPDSNAQFRLRTSWELGKPSTSTNIPPSSWFKNEVNILIYSSDCGTGVKEIHYTLDGNPEVVTAGSSASFNVTTEGGHSLSYYAVDYAGNTELSQTLNFQIDRTMPVITISGIIDGGTYFINDPVSANYTATDTLSGISSITGTVPGGGFIDTSTVGIHTFTVSATDQAGNTITTTYTYTVIFKENIDPDSNGSSYAYTENVGWINLNPSQGLGVTVTDHAVSGYAWGENIGWINLSPPSGGVRNDNTGNLSGYAWGENVGWINFAPVGGGVRINACGYFSGLAWGENIGWVNFEAGDAVSFRVRTAWDKVAPSTSPVTPVSEWNNTDVNITLAASDCGTGVRDIHYTLDDNPEVVITGSSVTLNVIAEGHHTLSYFSIDNADNIEVVHTLTFKIDKTPPVITISSPADGEIYFINDPVVAGFTVSDAFSGISSLVSTVPEGVFVDTSTRGGHTFTVSTMDLAGNSASVTHSYTVVVMGNVNSDNTGSSYAYGENSGWINLAPSGGSGMGINDSVIVGYAWSENIGWINLSCHNTKNCSAVNYGVANDGYGNLSGYAWSENAGWINFAPSGSGVRIDPNTGVFSGMAWGENIGWLNFAPSAGSAASSWRPINTQAGSNVTTSPGNGVTVTFSDVASTGSTTVVASPTGPTLPSGFALGEPPVYYEITTTAAFTPPVTVCIPYDPVRVSDPWTLRLNHYENNTWVDVTSSVDTINHNVCGSVNSLSPFAILTADIVPPTIAASISSTPGSTGWYTTDVTVTFTCSDSGSGIASCSPPVSVTTEGYDQVISGTAVDKAGNSTSTSVTVHLDKSPPVMTVPTNITADATTTTGAVVNYPPATATDVVDPSPSVNCMPISGSFFSIGTTTVNCSATDVAGNSAAGSFEVTVLNPLPVSYGQLVTTQEDTAVNIMLTGNDPNGDLLIYSIVTPPVNGSISGTAPFLTYTPNLNFNGKDSFTFKVSDGHLDSNTAEISITVTPVNDPPVLNSTGDRTIDEGSLLTFTISGNDPDAGDVLIYSATGLPVGAAFDTNTHTFSYTPAYDVSTRLADTFFDVFFDVSDGTGSASETVRITVHNVNRTPAASAGVDLQLECAGASCPVILDGRGSTDPDSTPGTQDDIALYRWYEGYGTVGQQLLGTGKEAVVTLSLGTHNVTLEITDQSGAIGTDTVAVTLDPAHLSMLTLEKAEVDWAKTTGGLAEIKLHGKLALPAGLLLQELTPHANISLDIAGLTGVFSNAVNFEVKGGEGEKWEYKANPAGAGTQNFSIHWKGAKFDYKNVIHLKSEFISLTETALAIDREGTTETVSLSVNGVTVSIDEGGAVTSSVPYEVDEDGEVTFTLPFELTPAMDITLTRSAQQPVVIHAGDFYTPGSGSFEWKGKVNPNGLTGASRPATVGMNLTLGNEGFPGSVAVSESQWDKLSTKEWKANLKK